MPEQEEVAATPERFDVVGPLRVAGVETGGVVDLDPARYNIDALIAAGHIARPTTAKKAGRKPVGDEPPAALGAEEATNNPPVEGNTPKE